MSYCPHCGTIHNDDTMFCANCGQKLKEPNSEKKEASGNNRSFYKESINASSIRDKFVDYIGSDTDVKLNWMILFSDVLKKHTNEEAEEIFTCGTEKTTPDPSAISIDFPKPWLYGRIFVGMLATFLLLWICVSAFDNSNALPGMIVIGSFTVPLSTMILFFEINVWRNISFYSILKIFFIGGCASLVATLVLFSIIPVDDLDYFGAFLTGFIEEVGKAIIVYFFIKRIKKLTLLNGLLYGACVGAGFAAFESAGYAFNFLFKAGYDGMMSVILVRGFLAPGGHVAWAAISGAAIVIASKKTNSSELSNIIKNPSFLRLFALPVIMHALWDCPLSSLILPEIHGLLIGLIVCVWFVILVLINMGLKEIHTEKK